MYKHILKEDVMVSIRELKLNRKDNGPKSIHSSMIKREKM